MKIDMSQTLLDLGGLPLRNNDEILTLGSVSIEALVLVQRDDRVNGGEKFKRYQIAQKIHGKDLIDLTLDEIVLIKDLIGKAYGPAVVGPAFNLLENPKKQSKGKK